jgi:hypothetical protein
MPMAQLEVIRYKTLQGLENPILGTDNLINN